MLKPKLKSRLLIALCVLGLYIGLALVAWILTANAAKYYLGLIAIATITAGIDFALNKNSKIILWAAIWFWLFFVVGAFIVLLAIGTALSSGGGIQF